MKSKNGNYKEDIISNNHENNSESKNLMSKKRERGINQNNSLNIQAQDQKHNFSDDEELLFTKSLNSTKTNIKTNYRVLEPFRSLGLIIDSNKFVYYKRANDRFILASNGNSFLLYNVEKLKLERISPPLPHKITALAMINNIIYTASNNIILAWNKIHIV